MARGPRQVRQSAKKPVALALGSRAQTQSTPAARRSSDEAAANRSKDGAGPLERAAREREAKRWTALRRRLRNAAAATAPNGLRKSADGSSLSLEVGGDSDRKDDVADAVENRARLDGTHHVAARLMLAKAIDACDGLAAELRSGAPVVAFDVADAFELETVECCWADVIFGKDAARILSLENTKSIDVRRGLALRGFQLVVKETPRTRGESKDRHKAALASLSWAKPVVALSPDASTHLPDPLLRAGITRVVVGPPDLRTIEETIRIVTGERVRGSIEPKLAAGIGLVEIAIAVRFDRSAAECMSRLRDLASAKVRNASGRDLTLDELHGMPEAIEWGKAFVRDIESYKNGAPWSAVDAGVVFDGPSGVGKTTVVRSIARAANCELLVASHARWQSSKEGHLGHFLGAMAKDFALARRKAKEGIVIFFVDEIDSFADRASLDHAYRDYSIAATNGFIFFCDSISGGDDELTDGRDHQKPRIVLMGACNDARRCDPAILRAGRFNRVIRIGLPNAAALEAMMRIRLKQDLRDADLSDLALMATGSTGAEVERAVNDARRFARHEGRDLNLDDLKRAFGGTREFSAARRARIAVHEAAHIMVDVLLHGAEGALATMTSVGDRLAGAFRLNDDDRPGTFDEHFGRLQVTLAGRAGEMETYNSCGEGSGGNFASDLHQATAAACAMVASLGLAGPPVFLGPAGDTRRLLAYPEVRTAAIDLLKRAEDACMRLIVRHRAALDGIAARLLADGRIDGPAVAGILAARGATVAGAVDDGPGDLLTATEKDQP